MAAKETVSGGRTITKKWWASVTRRGRIIEIAQQKNNLGAYDYGEIVRILLTFRRPKK